MTARRPADPQRRSSPSTREKPPPTLLCASFLCPLLLFPLLNVISRCCLRCLMQVLVSAKPVGFYTKRCSVVVKAIEFDHLIFGAGGALISHTRLGAGDLTGTG